MTPAAKRVLRDLVEMAEEDEIGEIVREGRQVWFGMERIAGSTLDSLISVMVVKRTCDGRDDFERFVLNETGKHVHARPELEGEIMLAVMKRQSFTIDGDHRLVPLSEAKPTPLQENA